MRIRPLKGIIKILATWTSQIKPFPKQFSGSCLQCEFYKFSPFEKEKTFAIRLFEALMTSVIVERRVGKHSCVKPSLINRVCVSYRI